MPLQQRGHQRAVADIATHENMSRAVLEGRKRVEIAGVSQLVEVDDTPACADDVEHEVAADEAGGAGDQDHG